MQGFPNLTLIIEKYYFCSLNIEKITFKVVQMKYLAMHITNQKLSFGIFTAENIQNIFIEHDFYLMS